MSEIRRTVQMSTRIVPFRERKKWNYKIWTFEKLRRIGRLADHGWSFHVRWHGTTRGSSESYRGMWIYKEKIRLRAHENGSGGNSPTIGQTFYCGVHGRGRGAFSLTQGTLRAPFSTARYLAYAVSTGKVKYRRRCVLCIIERKTGTNWKNHRHDTVWEPSA